MISIHVFGNYILTRMLYWYDIFHCFQI